MNDSERMERVSALAVQAKTDRSVISELWQHVERLVFFVCLRYFRQEKGNRLYDYDDLYQNAYFGFLKAIDAYDDSRGAFSTFLMFYIRQSCQEVIGQRGKRDPLADADSIDKPLPNADDDYTLADTLSDPDGETPYAIVERDMLVDTILSEADRLPDKRQRRIICEHTYQGVPLSELADLMMITQSAARRLEERAIIYLRRQPLIRAMCNEYRAEMRECIRQSAASPYRSKGVQSFHTDMTSVVEAAVMRR